MFRRPKVLYADQGSVVILGPRAWWRRFKRGPLGFWSGRLALAALVALVVSYTFFVRADTIEYHPNSCLGNWEGVENVLGEPEGETGSPPGDFNLDNSARFPGGDSQIFCGNFTGSDSAARKKTFRGATLRFAWVFNMPPGSPPPPPPPASIPILPFEEFLTGTPSSSPSSSEAVSPSVSEPLPPAPPPAPSSSVPEQPAFRWLFPLAFAQSAGDPSSTQPVSAPPQTTPISEPASTTADAATSTPTTTLEIPFDPSAPPSEPLTTTLGDDDILHISFSLDGQNWVFLGQVNEKNWQDASFSLSALQSWEDLERLQISVKGIPGRTPPGDVLLDGMTLEVEADTPDFFDAFFAPAEPVPPPPPPPLAPARTAKHKCFLEPFAVEMKPGAAASLAVDLYPSEEGMSYLTNLGSLPEGVTGSVRPNGTSTTSLRLDLNSQTSAPPGSYSLVFVYQENQPDGAPLTAFCQYNLILKP